MAQMRCGACFGRKTNTCPGCGGRRQLSRLTINMEVELYMCMVCGGRGHVACQSCGGRGEIYVADIPIGVATSPPEMVAAGPPAGIEGRWTAQDGSWWQFDGAGPVYRASGGSVLGTTEQGTARLTGDIIDIEMRNALLGEYHLRVQRRGEVLQGLVNVMGFSVPLVLRRTSWPKRDRPAAEDVAARYATALQKAIQARNAGNHDAALKGFLEALEHALKSPQPDDDIEAMQHILILSRAIELPVDTVQKCADCLLGLVDKGHHGDGVLQCLAFILMMALVRPLKPGTMSALLDAAADAPLEDIKPEVRISLASGVVRGLLAAARVDEAEAFLDDLPAADIDGDLGLDLAMLRADIAVSGSDRDGAAGILQAGLQRFSGVSQDKRLDLIAKLVVAWPPGDEGVRPWLDELRRGADGRPEPLRSLSFLQVAIGLAQAKEVDRAQWALDQLDLERARRDTPQGMHEMLEHVLAQAKDLMKIARMTAAQ